MRSTYCLAIARVVAFGSAMVVGGACFADATVESIQGSVKFNRSGTGFQTIITSTSGKPGDRVLSGPDGGAMITYDDGCKLPLKPNQVVSIGSVSPCKLASNGGNPANAQAAADAAAAADAGTVLPAVTTPLTVAAIVGGSALAAGGVYWAEHIRKQRPASP